jgi:hypothetical protein
VIERLRIPNLGPRGGRIVRASLAVLGVACTIIFAIGAVLVLRLLPAEQTLSQYGLFAPRYGTFEGGVLGTPLTQEARSAGLTAGQKLIAVNGARMAASFSTDDLARRLVSGGARAALTVQDPNGRRISAVVTRSAAHASELYGGKLSVTSMTLTQWTVQVLNTFVSLAAAALLLWRRSRDSVAMLFVYQALVFVATSRLGWTAGSALGILTPMFELSELANAVWFMLPFIFPDGAFRSWWRLACVAFGWLLVAVDNMGAAKIALPHWVQTVGTVASLVLSGPVFLLALYLRYRGTSDRAVRQQLKPAIFGLAISALLVVPASFMFQAAQFTQDTSVILALFNVGGVLSTLSSAALSLGFLVALLRYRLYDADSTIRRTVSYGAVAVSIVVLFTAVEKMIEALGQAYLGGVVGVVGSGVAGTLVALIIVPLNHRVTEWAKRRFEKDLIALREDLAERVRDMRETAPPAQLAEMVLRECDIRAHAVRGTIVQAGEIVGVRGVDVEAARAWLDAFRPTEGQDVESGPVDDLFPMRIRLHAGVADARDRNWLLLGPRPDGSLYGREERQALRQVAPSVARALAIAREREHTITTLVDRLDQYADRVQQLEARLAETLRAQPPTAPAAKPA